MIRSASAIAALVAIALLGVAWAEAPAGPAPPSGAALAALAQPPARSSLASQRIYFVLPDRYANGDPANDRGGKTGPRSVTGFDPTDTGWFHGGDYRGLTGDCVDARRGLARIRSLGFTAVWVTPPYGQQAVQGSSAAYHGYWIRDFTSIDPHLGTDQDFGAFVECAHRLGLKVYLDVVVNHTADVIVPTGTAYSDAPYRTCAGKPFDPARYAGGTTFPCVKASTMPRVPVLLAGSRNAKKPAWLNDVRRYHNRGDIAFDSCSELCFEQGDFYGLDDLFTEQPTVVNGLARVYGDWIRRYRVDGFRIDTARHVNRVFFRRFVPQVLAAARAAGVPDFEIFGEVFLTDAVELAPFVRDRGLPNVLDFPLQDALVRFASGTAGALGIASRFEDDDYFQQGGLAATPPTFLGNHDMGRVANLVGSASGASGTALLQRVLLSHSLLYLLRGAPVVYYGDEVGLVGRGGDKAARQDLFPTMVSEWRTEPRVGSPPVGSGSSFDQPNHPVAEHLRRLAALRDAHPALSTGSTTVRHAARNVLVVSRFDAAARREYVAAFNAGTAAATVTVPTSSPTASWTTLLGDPGVVGSAGGSLRLTLAPLSASLLRAGAEVTSTPPQAPRLTVAVDDLSDLRRATAAVASGGPVSISFAIRRAGAKAWTRLGVDDSPPYRTFLDPTRYRRDEVVYLVATARSLDGSVAVSPVVSFTNR